MRLALTALFGAAVLGAAATAYPDPAGDVPRGSGPDIASVAVSNTKTTVTFRVTFTTAPPLRASAKAGWVDMLLVSLDVPPLGPAPDAQHRWAGANFALGTHGPSTKALMVRLGPVAKGVNRVVATFPVTTRGRTVTLAVPRRPLAKAASFAFDVAVAREYVQGKEPPGAKPDFAPARGTFRYALTG